MIKRILGLFKKFGAPDELEAVSSGDRAAVDQVLRDRWVRLERLKQEVDVLGRRDPGNG